MSDNLPPLSFEPPEEDHSQEEINSVKKGPFLKSNKKAKVILTSLLLFFLTFSLAGAAVLVQRQQDVKRVEAIQGQYQCVSGCDGRVCQSGDTGYTWCSKDTRCGCTGVGTAAPYNPQYWCEGTNTMHCGEISPGSCGTMVDQSDRANCGGTTGACNSHLDCEGKGMVCEWPASTYCYNNQCTCMGKDEQQAYSAGRWPVCTDSSPKCTPPGCPSGWADCGLNYARTDYSSSCEKKTQCGAEKCADCGNEYYVFRYCKPQPQSTPTPTPGPMECKALNPTPAANQLDIRSTATLTCAATSDTRYPINHFEFRVVVSASGETQTFPNITANNTPGTNEYKAETDYTIMEYGCHRFECRACRSIDSSNCTQWGQAN